MIREEIPVRSPKSTFLTFSRETVCAFIADYTQPLAWAKRALEFIKVVSVNFFTRIDIFINKPPSSEVESFLRAVENNDEFFKFFKGNLVLNVFDTNTVLGHGVISSRAPSPRSRWRDAAR